MQLPEHMPVDRTDRETLGLFYNLFNNNQWFHRAEIILNHPNQMRKTLEIHAMYNPLLQMKDILAFTDQYKLGLEIVDLSHGN
jgi:hypothetical protein